MGIRIAKLEDSLNAYLKILGMVKKDGPLSGYEIAKRMGGFDSITRHRLKRLVEVGQLDCMHSKKTKLYSIPKNQGE